MPKKKVKKKAVKKKVSPASVVYTAYTDEPLVIVGGSVFVT